MRFFHRQISQLLLISMLFGSLTLPASAGAKSKAPVSVRQTDVNDEEGGLTFRLSQAPDQPEAAQQPPSQLAPTTVLSDLETANILKRLAPIKVEANDEQEFAMRERSLPPPRTGQTISVSFPPAANVAPAETVASGPLEVVRYSPEGAVPIAPNLSVTFSQPMVAVSSQEEAAAYVPVKLSPQPPGKWRWLGTRTLLFEPTGRFPMATNYSVAVPAGTKSATGRALGGAKTWTFATPAPKVKQTYPPANATQARDALMFIEFDQRIDPAAVLKTIKVVGGKTELRTRLASTAEIEANENVHNLTKDAEKDRRIAFRAVDGNGDPRLALPANESINIVVGPGTPSAEGPVTTKEQQSFAFRTFGPLQLLNAQCQTGNNNSRDCTPADIWRFEFSNDLDADSFQESQVRIDPVTPGLKLVRSSGVINVFGTKKPNTTYHVTIDKSLRDQFGQTLGEDKTVEFKIVSSSPILFLSGQGFAVLDPAAPRTLSLYSLNFTTVKVSLYAVEPEDWSKYQEYRQKYSRNTNEAKGTLPGRAVFSKQIILKSNPNEMIETAIDLTPALKEGLGQVIVLVEPVTPANTYHYPLMAWVQSTKIGLDAFVDNEELIGWATSLENGAPLGDVQMKVIPTALSGVTGPDGLAHLPLQPTLGSPASVLIARRGNDVAILPEGAQYWFNGNGFWHRKPQTDELRWYVFDDRRLYRPGEEVHLKGWIRRIGEGRGGDVGPLNGAVRRVRYKVEDDSENEIGKGELTLNLFGGFDATFKLPPTMNLGIGTVEFEAIDGDDKLTGRNSQHQFQVQEFRRPEFEVTAKTESEGPLFVGGHADIGVTANYFSGGGLQNADVKWSVTSNPTNFTPPNRDDYTFGKWTPWWLGEGADDDGNVEELTGRTDAAGKHRLRIDFESVKPARPSTVIAEASVTDVNRQTWTSTAILLVHPASLYVGLKSDRIFVQQGEPLVVHSIVTDLDGKAIANRDVNIHAVLLDWKQVKNKWQQVEANPQDCSIQSGPDAVKCTFASKDGGVYRIVATVRDDHERMNKTEFTLWVAGGKRQPQRDLEEEKVELIPDRREYKAGDIAQILVQAPFYPAEAVMSVRRSGIVNTQRFRMDGPTYTLKVPIEETWTPNARVQVDLVGATERSSDVEEESKVLKALPKRPAFASGELNLSIPPGSRELKVSAAPQNGTLEPGATTTVDIDVKNAEGRPVGDSEVALVVVDESVLALTQYKIADPLKIFYEERSSGVNDYHLRQNVLLASTLDLLSARQISQLPVNGRANFALAKMAPGLAMASETVSVSAARSMNNFDFDGVSNQDSQKTEVQLRKDFNALAVFAPSVQTDANGRAHVQVKLPDNLTRYRVMAVAVAGGKQFGTGESAITARLPLMARPSAPRFLNFGDRFEFPIIVQNQTDSSIVVDLAVRATNAAVSSFNSQVSDRKAGAEEPETSNAKPVTSTGRRVTVPANDRVEVRIPAAAVKAGTARFQVAAVSGKWSDAAEVELPVWTPATTEAFATYGEIDEGAITQRVKAPANVFRQFGGLEIETSSTQLQQLTDAFLYLQGYPYECSEQLSSRIISVAALRDVLTAFKAKDLPSPEEMEAAVVRDLKSLQGMQNDDGGFGFWKRGNESWPYLGIHVAHALARAKQKKFDVPGEMFDRSLKYLREIGQHIPSSYSVDAKRAIFAYALYVRAQMGDRDAVGARRLIQDNHLENFSLESVGWLLAVLSNDKESLDQVTAIRRLLSNRVTETAATAHFVCSYKDSDYLLLNSDRRADGIILEALIGDQPSSDLIPKIVRGLLDHRTRGRWENTQENVFILLALDRYFNAYEKVSPNFVARVWLGNAFAGEQQFKGRSTDRRQLNVPMSYLVDKGSGQSSGQNLILSKEGPGRLYYRLGMNYAPLDLDLKAADYGFVVTRSYEAVDHPEDVRQDADGTWHIKAGARVRVRLTMVAPARRYHVALVDPLPAGFETLNPVLATSESIPEDKKQTGVSEYGNRSFDNPGWWYWRSVWFDHQNLRDERAEAFTSLLWEGVYNYSYVARATTPGAFMVPPAKAEEMYHPETFGRGKSDRVRVE